MKELASLQRTMHRLTNELIASCPFCVSIEADDTAPSPVHCTKWSGSSFPVRVNPATCLTCGEYRKPRTIT